MICREVRRLSVSDDPRERERFRRHARGCPECRRLRDADDRLQGAARRWRRETPAPPPALKARVRAAVLREPSVSPAPSRRWIGRRAWLPLAAAAAAVLVLAVALALVRPGGPAPVSTGGRLLLDEALAAARDAERQHARAVAELERAAQGALARADDPATPAREAALLMSYRHRLRSLDTTIAEIRDYLEDNPGLPGARAVLLAAYIDKTDVLREVLARSEGRDA